MKTPLYALFMCVSTIVAGTLPPDAALLRAKRDSKILEINRIYAAELDKLQKKAMASGDLEAATLIQKEIDEVTPDPFKEDTANQIVGKWKMFGKSGNVVKREFTSTHLIDESGGKHPYEVKDGFITIKWGDTLWERLSLKQLRDGIMTGANSGGQELIYRNR